MHSTTNPTTRILERVQEGMKVVDTRGEEIGKVDHVKMGDPEAVTTQGNAPASAGDGVNLFSVLIPDATGGEPDVPEPRRSHLQRIGYAKIDGSGLFAEDRYVAADEIAEVSGETVVLGTSRQNPPTAPAPVVPTSSPTTPNAQWHTPAVSSSTEDRQDEGSSRTPVLVAGLAVGLGALGGGLLAGLRWRRERNRPINRLQRRARAAMQRTGEYLPDDARSRGGLGSALLGLLALGWLLRGRTSAEETSAEQPPVETERIQVWVNRGSDDVPTGYESGSSWGWMGAALAAGLAGTVLWRMRPSTKRLVYVGTPGVETAGGRDRTRSGELSPRMGVEHSHPYN